MRTAAPPEPLLQGGNALAPWTSMPCFPFGRAATSLPLYQRLEGYLWRPMRLASPMIRRLRRASSGSSRSVRVPAVLCLPSVPEAARGERVGDPTPIENGPALPRLSRRNSGSHRTRPPRAATRAARAIATMPGWPPHSFRSASPRTPRPRPGSSAVLSRRPPSLCSAVPLRAIASTSSTSSWSACGQRRRRRRTGSARIPQSAQTRRELLRHTGTVRC